MLPSQLCTALYRYLRHQWRWLIMMGLATSWTMGLGTTATADYTRYASPEAAPQPVITRGIGVEARIQAIEQTWEADYTAFLRSPSGLQPLDGADVAATLAELNTQTGHRLGLVYIVPESDGLELVLASPDAAAVQYRLEVPRSRFEAEVDNLQRQILRPNSDRYLAPAQQLYQWLIAPMEADLGDRRIDTLVFCVGERVRSLPLAALHDGQQFLAEKYDLGLIPALTLTDPQFRALRQVDVLAMGASEFNRLADLPAVSVELSTVADELWPGVIHLNADFTKQVLQRELAQAQYEIVHLATHAEFQEGAADQSFIQLWQDEQLNLLELRDLDWQTLPVELLVLSACQTALGNPQAELGFAGLAYQTGVRSALASLWSVSDVGTLALMREFYGQLAQAQGETKAAVLGSTQRAMIHGEVTLTETQLVNSSGQAIALPLSLQAQVADIDLSHPFYWSAFVLVGAPW
ncbi:CHAT domain-containing protein [Leptolyngbya iicbica]|uniref:CHAT domain-containing protein n=2 Tax=Cyanophyceae TaxID=3028117 RepID=A0A4Q7E2K0_9CYAN|nr:CHAT domain-containing protein [Leptolyngbya sp. LK]RZM75606.1 CHAT domain-containing protein [Leptolyngbya sp. LK]